MLNPKIGETMIRVTPPARGMEGYSQSGTVDRMDDETIDLIIQVDIPRRMTFNRADGFDKTGLGTFIVRMDCLS